MVCIGNFVAQLRWPRHRKDGVPRKLCGSVRWSRHKEDAVPRNFCGSLRWSRHRKDGAPRKLCGSVKGGLGTRKMVCLRNFVAQ